MGGARGGEVGYARGVVWHSVLAAAVLAALAACPGTAAAFDALVGWSPVQNAAGYRLYLRQSGQTYGAGVDVGLIQADAGGVVRYTARGLPIGVINYFAVTAYDASARESGLSNELSLLVTATPGPTSTPPVTATSSLTPTAGATATRTATASSTTTANTATPTLTATRAPPTNTANPASSATPSVSSTATPTRTIASTPTSSPVGAVGAGGPVAAYAFGEGSGTTVVDVSGNGHTGTLFGSPLRTTG